MGIQIFNQKNNAWRDAYNPLRGMSLPKLVSLLEAGERGQYCVPPERGVVTGMV